MTEAGKRLLAILKAYAGEDTREQRAETILILELFLRELKGTTPKRRYQRITGEVLGRVMDYVKSNPNATNRQIEAACGLGINTIATNKGAVLEGMTLDEVVNYCRINSVLLTKRKRTAGEMAQERRSIRFE